MKKQVCRLMRLKYYIFKSKGESNYVNKEQYQD